MPQLLNRGRVLIGYMNEPEAVSFLKRRCVFEGDKEEEARKVYANFVRVAQDLPRLSTKVREKRFATEDLRYLRENVPTDRIREGALRGLPWSFKQVEIDGLVCVQKYVNLTYIDMISKGCDFRNFRDVIDICLTDRFLYRGSTVTKVSEREYRVGAEGDDLRLLSATTTYDDSSKTRTIEMKVGWGMPSTLVVRIGDRYHLKNGCHRIYALRAHGIKYVPCILVEGKTYANLGLPGQPGFFSESLALSAAPPTFAAYFSDRLSATLNIRPRHTLITVAAHILKTPSEEGLVKDQAASLAARKRDTAIEDVDTVTEGWNVYSLADGNILKLRQLVRGVGRIKDKNGEVIASVSQTPVLVSVIPKTLGHASHRDYGRAELRSSVEEEDVKFKEIEEPVNEYVTKSGMRFAMTLGLVQVSRTSKFDRDGVPIYLVKTESSLERL